MAGTLRVEHDGPIAHIIFGSDKGVNVLSSELLKTLKSVWTGIEGNTTRVCILRGEGKAFLAGADIKEMSAFDASAAREFAALGQDVFDRIEKSDIVSIAAIHGACLGGGCELALACDIRMGSAGMLIGQPEVNLGLIPGFGGSQRLPRVVGLGTALRMILTGQPLNADEALRCSLITDTGSPDDLAERATQLAKVIASRGPDALRLAKKLTRTALNVDQSAGLKAERYAFGTTFGSGEAAEGISAFIEKRPPAF